MTEVTKHEPGSFCWPELATTDAGGAKKFYTTLFEWGFSDSPAGPDMIYTLSRSQEKEWVRSTRWGRSKRSPAPLEHVCQRRLGR